jgi:AcrR family transcriptional regulator
MLHSFCLKIDDIARYMDISKATLYKDFSTRVEIIEVVVAHYIDYLSEAMLLFKMKMSHLPSDSRKRLNNR